MWVQLFYWMRLFKETSVLIRMLGQIIHDIKAFSVMLLICVGLFATTNLILDQGRKDNGIDSPISDVAMGNAFVDSFIRAYLVGLGDYSTDSFSA